MPKPRRVRRPNPSAHPGKDDGVGQEPAPVRPCGRHILDLPAGSVKHPEPSVRRRLSRKRTLMSRAGRQLSALHSSASSCANPAAVAGRSVTCSAPPAQVPSALRRCVACQSSGRRNRCSRTAHRSPLGHLLLVSLPLVAWAWPAEAWALPAGSRQPGREAVRPLSLLGLPLSRLSRAAASRPGAPGSR
jgi:hypothetical protein